MSDKEQVNRSTAGEPVWLHIYDVFGALEKVNSFMKPVGSGAFHAGVEVYGKEWSYGYAAEGSDGIYWNPPRCNDRHRYRESVQMGGTSFGETEVLKMVLGMRHEWPGFAYDILVRNCCHFSDALCRKLGAGPAPEWLMHLAGAGAALASGMEKAVVSTHAAAGLAAAKACEFDEHYHLSERAEKFLSQEVQMDEDVIGAKAQDLWSRAIERLAPMGALAEMVIDEALKPISEEHLEFVETRARELWAAPSAAPVPAEGPQAFLQRWWRKSPASEDQEQRLKVVACQPVVRDWSRSPEFVRPSSVCSSLECSPGFEDGMTAEEAAAACEALAARPRSPCSGAGGDSTCSSPIPAVKLQRIFSEDEEDSTHSVAGSTPPRPQQPSSPELLPEEWPELAHQVEPHDLERLGKTAQPEAVESSPGACGVTPLPPPPESIMPAATPSAVGLAPGQHPAATAGGEAGVAGDPGQEPLAANAATSAAGVVSRAISGAASTIRMDSTTSGWSLAELWGRAT